MLSRRSKTPAREFQCIKTTLLASMRGYAPQVAIEFGRRSSSPVTARATELEVFEEK